MKGVIINMNKKLCLFFLLVTLLSILSGCNTTTTKTDLKTGEKTPKEIFNDNVSGKVE